MTDTPNTEPVTPVVPTTVTIVNKPVANATTEPVANSYVPGTEPVPPQTPPPLPEVNTSTSNPLATFAKWAAGATVVAVTGLAIHNVPTTPPPTPTSPPAIVQEHVPVVAPVPAPEVQVPSAPDPKAVAPTAPVADPKLASTPVTPDATPMPPVVVGENPKGTLPAPVANPKGDEPTPAPAPTAQGPTVNKAHRFYLVMNNPDGTLGLRLGGSVGWRYNNPGKFVFKKFAKSEGAIGSDGYMAIFPSYEAGKKAMHDFLFDSKWGYTNLTVDQAVRRYLNKKSGYDLDDAMTQILDDADFKGVTKLSSLTDAQREFFLTKLALADTFHVGTEKNFKDPDELSKAGY